LREGQSAPTLGARMIEGRQMSDPRRSASPAQGVFLQSYQ
jgi:hypothetical protein